MLKSLFRDDSCISTQSNVFSASAGCKTCLATAWRSSASSVCGSCTSQTAPSCATCETPMAFNLHTSCAPATGPVVDSTAARTTLAVTTAAPTSTAATTVNPGSRCKSYDVSMFVSYSALSQTIIGCCGDTACHQAVTDGLYVSTACKTCIAGGLLSAPTTCLDCTNGITCEMCSNELPVSLYQKCSTKSGAGSSGLVGLAIVLASILAILNKFDIL